jgi:pyroglutamyl-peptidase
MNTFSKRPVLLTGFEPFAGGESNPSWEAVSALDGARIGGRRIVARRLPVSFAGAPRALNALLNEYEPALTLCTGLDGVRPAVYLERMAVNLADADIADNDGVQPVDASIWKAGPAAYFATVPLKAMLAALLELGCPAAISYSAGTYVCNATFYGLMRALKRKADAVGGFIHIPHLRPEAVELPWATYPALPLELIVQALQVCVHVALSVAPEE